MARRGQPGLIDGGKGIFVHNPRTAGSSIAAALGCRDSHETAWELRKRYGFSAWSKAWTFGMVRHPWSRAVSWFLWNHTNGTVQGFREWVAGGCQETWLHYNWVGKQVRPLRQVECFVGQGGVIVDHIGRFENLAEEFSILCDLFGCEDVTLPHIGATPNPDFLRFYDDASRDAIAELDRWAIKKFGYEFEGPL